MDGYINSFQSMGTVDGPGVRCVIFMQGCPLRCVYCHNPETWVTGTGVQVTPKEMLNRIKRYKSYISKGGVTVSGGEALLQARFVKEFFAMCREERIHTALDTSGCIINDDVHDLLDVTDLCLLDIKMTTPEEYKKYTGVSLNTVLKFLDILQEKSIDTWIRQVIVPDINDNFDNIDRLNDILRRYNIVKKVELLPFRKLCLEKYKEMGKPFPLADTPEATPKAVAQLQKAVIL